MNYTDLNRVKLMLHSQTSGSSGSSLDATLLETVVIPAASRAWDRKVTQSKTSDAMNYFMTEAVTSENIEGQINAKGEVCCFPHKSEILSVSAFSYQSSIISALNSVDPARIKARGGKVTAYPTNLGACKPSKCDVILSYVGGSGSSVDDLPGDMIDAVTLLAIRFYREVETGLGDQIGIAELATIIYTKAWPIRCMDSLSIFMRRSGWNHYG
jgi:hypothetical protein